MTIRGAYVQNPPHIIRHAIYVRCVARSTICRSVEAVKEHGIVRKITREHIGVITARYVVTTGPMEVRNARKLK